MTDNERKGRIHIEYLDKNRVQIEVDNESCKFLIELFTEFMTDPKMHHIDLDSGTGYSCGFMTKESIALIINNRDHYDQ